MDVRSVELFVVDGAFLALATGYHLIFLKQRKIIKLQQETITSLKASVASAGEGIARIKLRLESSKQEREIVESRRSGQLAIGIATKDGEWFATITYPGGESFRGPSRETEEEAMADVIKKKEEIISTLGDRIKLVHGPGVGPVH